MPLIEFRTESLVDIIRWIERTADVRFSVLDPDRGRGHYAGEIVEGCVYRPWRVWTELAQRMGMRMLTPRAANAPLVELAFERLAARRWQPADGATERYGAGSGFERIHKLEDPYFVLDLEQALARVALAPGARVLDLGCNTADVLAMLPANVERVGVDHSASALAIARARLPQARFIAADVAQLSEVGLELGRFDLVISIGLLQSGAIDDRALLRQVVQDLLSPTGAVIFGWPNCRYVDGEVDYGARIVNLSEPELGLVIKDIAFYRKYLAQHGRQVFVFGKNYVLISGVCAGATLPA
jgi:SAM-dependent methyltransferase